MMTSRLTKNFQTKILLFLILLLAAFFRFYNLNWDEGHFFHSDERNIAMGVANLTLFSQMDPKFYAYGGFLIYIYKITADIVGFILSIPHFASDWAYINVLGRYYSAFFSTMTIIPLFHLTRTLINKKTAFLCVILYAFTVSSIQTAHFSITENLLTFLLVTVTYLTVLYYTHQQTKILLITGVLLGIAVATKTTGLSYFLIPGVLLLTLLFQKKISFLKATSTGIMVLILSFVTFVSFSPFTFLNWDAFYQSMRFENEVVLGINPVVYTLQFTHTLPYLFQLKNLFFQIGPVFIFSLLGALYLFYYAIKQKKWIFMLVFSFPLFYFAYVGSWHTKFIRYMVPLIPFFLILASILLIKLQNSYKKIGIFLVGISVLSSFLWAISFTSIYTRPQTRITASQWIYKQIPPGSRILGEHWDEGLPVPLTTGSPDNYSIAQLTIYEPDTKAKITYYSDVLSTADYLTITTRRLYGTLMYLPEKYPLTSIYYKLLFEEKLGYTKIAEFSSYPTLFGITINDDKSEETFQVYDHPKSFIFKNTKRLSPNEIEVILRKSVNAALLPE